MYGVMDDCVLPRMLDLIKYYDYGEILGVW